MFFVTKICTHALHASTEGYLVVAASTPTSSSLHGSETFECDGDTLARASKYTFNRGKLPQIGDLVIEGGRLVPYDKKTRVETTQGGVEIFQALQQEPANFFSL